MVFSLILFRTKSSGAAGLINAVRWATFLAIPNGGIPDLMASSNISMWWMDCNSWKYCLISFGSRSVDGTVPTGAEFKSEYFCESRG